MENNRWFIIEIQHRADGDFNFVKTEKYSVKSALGYYYSRISAYETDTTYPKALVSVMDACKVLDTKVVETSYVAPTE